MGTLSSESSGDYGYGAEKALDGNTAAVWHSLTVTKPEISPWIQVDLSESHCIQKVKIFDRAFGSDPVGK